ncbi:hypothetical protein DEO72_LG10g1228 [Vigna unguiculata]|uniref:Transmembrane protein n=1 Tax=Vigna unguiculata TaxID=3917 RepID=A0A4D6NCZ3_VIGUN|nr:hypothetical protein DEO72_LG10g1228 [Vigna unguiculata]
MTLISIGNIAGENQGMRDPPICFAKLQKKKKLLSFPIVTLIIVLLHIQAVFAVRPSLEWVSFDVRHRALPLCQLLQPPCASTPFHSTFISFPCVREQNSPKCNFFHSCVPSSNSPAPMLLNVAAAIVASPHAS